MKDVISCSRRTDIPAFHYDWLQERLMEKKVTLINPYSNQPYNVDLTPENIHSIVMWSKNYENVLKDPGMLTKYNLYFQFTINGYSKYMEPNTPDYRVAMDQVRGLCDRYSPKQVSWRFDPILFCNEAEEFVSANPIEHRLGMFTEIAESLADCGIDKCTFSFISIYGKVIESFKAKNVDCKEIPKEEKIAFAKRMVDIAKPLGIQLYSCCEEVLESVEGVKKSHCVDGKLLKQLFGDSVSSAKDQGQRLTCGCTKSKEIGSYSQRCSHKCVYCYANPSSYTVKE